MKKIIVGVFVAVFAMSLFPIAVQALTLLDNTTQVGIVDDYLACTDDLVNSNPETEAAWVSLALGFDVYFAGKIEFDGGEWKDVSGDIDIKALDISSFGEVDYYVLKTGTLEDCTWFLYHNLNEIDWAVIDLGDDLAWGGADVPIGLTKISHITAFVPEPTTMLLFGSSLVGLMLYGRRRSRKEADKTS